MFAHRAIVLLTGAAALTAAPGPAAAQVQGDIVLNILRECSRIDDPTSRLACYDNNIRAAGGQARTSVPGRMGTPNGGGGVKVGNAGGGAANSGGNFGLPTPSVGQQAIAPGADTLSARVAKVDPREPGVYLLTLSDGEQWLFNESVSKAYSVPGNGDTITIDRAAVGSYLMHFGKQPGVRIRRIR